jgi:hypothetical protein
MRADHWPPLLVFTLSTSTLWLGAWETDISPFLPHSSHPPPSSLSQLSQGTVSQYFETSVFCAKTSYKTVYPRSMYRQ